MMINKEFITLELKVEETNLILGALGDLPYVKVADLIEKIQTQGSSQLQVFQSDELMTAELADSSKKQVNNGK